MTTNNTPPLAANTDALLPLRAAAPQDNLRVLGRFIGGMPLLLRWLPAILTVIALAATAPQFFLWYIGEYVRCAAPPCSAHWDRLPDLLLPLTMPGLMLIAFGGMVFRIVAWIAFELTGMWATNDLHDRMIAALTRARTTYFDETPSGHLINRITGDFSALRFMGIIRIGDLTNTGIEVLATMVLVLLVSPWAGLVLLPVTLLLVWVQLQIGPMLGHAEELGSEATGEMLHRETDIIEGRRMFALYGKEPELLRTLQNAYRRRLDFRLLSARLQAWSQAWTKMIAAVYGFGVMTVVTLAVQQGRISLTLAAVILSALFALGGSFRWLTTCLAFLTETLGNARRVYEIVDLPPEEAGERSGEAISPSRPAEPLAAVVPATLAVPRGDIVFHNYTAAYRVGMNPVLRGLEVTLAEGKRTGLVGRTGAGKSSIVQALFRMMHVYAGDLTIGGTSVYDVDLIRLRASFGVVPQNPYLFKGTLRQNIDREGGADDAAIGRVLRAAGLTLAPALVIDEGGRNLSLGERQLICLARVLLTDKRVIVMDEPTSAVDPETDAKIQQVLAHELRGRTILTIAHRLQTLVGYDTVVEMEEGRVVRVAPPDAFLQT